MTGETADGRPDTGTASGNDRMTPERLEKIQDLLLGALDVPADERAGFLSRACGDDAALRREVESLLQAHSTSGPIDRMADTLGARVLAEFVEGGGLEGETIGRYTVMERLGRGGMSVIYRAWDPGLEREVALKFLPVLLSSDKTSRERFLVEAQAAAGLEHPNICTIHEIGETEDGRLFIAMPLYDGQTIRAKLETGPLSEEEVLRLALQAAKGLATAHERGVVHRDVKPDNLMITPDGTLKILDFGIAQLEGATDATGQTPGTAYYMSPEQAAGRSVDARTDLWSLGVVLYEMLAGRRPVEGATLEAVRQAIIEDDVAPLARVRPDVSSGLASLIDSLLQKDPSRRPESAAEIEKRVRKLRREPAPGTVQKGWLPVAGGLLGIALLTFGGIWYLRDGLSSARPAVTVSDPRSIAVLPFADRTGDPDNEQLITGLNAVLLTQLHAVSGLTPVSASSLGEYATDAASLAGIARDLNVSTVLTGSLQRDGDRVLFSARLIDGTTGKQLWADLFRRELTKDSLFAIQVDIARRIADALSLETPADRSVRAQTPPTENRDAYEYYVRGKALLTDPMSAPGATGDAEWMFRQAVRLDSTFALAWAALAEWHSSAPTGVSAVSRATHRLATLPGPGRMTADLALARAVAWGPDLPETMKAQGWYEFNVERNREAALVHFEQALRARPNDPDLAGAIGQILISRGEWEQGLLDLERALRLDGGSFWRAVLLAQMYTRVGRYDDAERLFDAAIATAPAYAEAYIGKAIAQLKRDGDVEGANRVLEQASATVDPGELIYRFAQPGARYPFIRILDTFFHAALADSAVARHVHSRCTGCYWHLQAQLAELRHEPDVARTYYDSAFSLMVQGSAPERRSYGYAARFAAGLGRIREAARYADTAMARSATLSIEAVSGYTNLGGQAEVYVRIGQFDKAIAAVEQLLSHPGLLSVHVFELDPLWDPLRGRPEFRRLMAEYH